MKALIEKIYYVYIMASGRNGTIYVGVTGNLIERVREHKTHKYTGFTDEYNVDKLVYFERYNDITAAIHREKRLKEWQRNWKKDLIEKMNPNWDDLFENINMMI